MTTKLLDRWHGNRKRKKQNVMRDWNSPLVSYASGRYHLLHTGLQVCSYLIYLLYICKDKNLSIDHE